jgi:hypothetical protein
MSESVFAKYCHAGDTVTGEVHLTKDGSETLCGEEVYSDYANSARFALNPCERCREIEEVQNEE